MDESPMPPQPSNVSDAVEPAVASESTVMPTSVPPATPPPTPTPGPVAPKPRPKRSIYITLGILLVILLALIAWRVAELRQQASTAATKPIATVPAATTVSPVSGSDNQSLTSDLSTVNNGLNTESQAQDSADAAINDQQQEINVPTN